MKQLRCTILLYYPHRNFRYLGCIICISHVFFTWSSVPRSKTVVIVQTFFNLWCTKQTLHLVGVSTRTTQGVHKNLEEFQTILNSHLVKSEMEFTMFLTCEIRCKIFINLMVKNQLIHRSTSDVL